MLDSFLGANTTAKRIQTDAARVLHGVGVSANAATIAAVVVGVLAGVAFARASVGLGILLLGISAVLDALDGTMAREFSGASTPFGGIMDLCFDRVVECAAIIGIVWPHPELGFCALLLVASWYVNITVFLAVGAALENAGPKLIQYPPGILERTEALIFFVVLALIAWASLLRLAAALCIAMTILEIATGAQRFLFGRARLRT